MLAVGCERSLRYCITPPSPRTPRSWRVHLGRLNGPAEHEEYYEPDMLAVMDIALFDLPHREFETPATPLGYSAGPACRGRIIIPSKRILQDDVFTYAGDVDILLTLGP